MKTIGIIMLLTLKLFCFSQIGENDFGHKVNCIRSIKKGDVDGEYLINVTIKGGVEIEETAEYKEEIPEGFSAKSLIVNDNRCISSANNGSISFKWKTGFPKYSQITMSYILVNNSSNSDTIKLSRSYLKYLSHEGSQGIYNANITFDNYTLVIKKISDNDGDGIYNDRDECPDYFGKKETNECPDFDNDGIKDSEDKCPDIFGLKNNFGCPLSEKPKEEVKLELNTFKILYTTNCKYVFKYNKPNYISSNNNKMFTKGDIISIKNNKEDIVTSNIYVNFEWIDGRFNLEYPIKNGLLYTKNLESTYTRFEVDTINDVIDTSTYYNKFDIEKIVNSQYLYKKFINNNWEYVDLYSNKILNHFGEGKLFSDKTIANNEFTFAILSDNNGLKMSVIGISDNKEFLPVLTDKKYVYISFLYDESNNNNTIYSDSKIKETMLELINKTGIKQIPEYLRESKIDEHFIIACLNADGLLEIISLSNNSKTHKTEFELLTKYDLRQKGYFKLRHLLLNYPINNTEIRKAIN